MNPCAAPLIELGRARASGRPAAQRRLGWTLVELLVGLGIFALVATAVYTALQVGISAFKRLDQGADHFQELRVALDRLAIDLRHSFPTKKIDETLWQPFEGLPDRLTFVGLLYRKDPDGPQGRWQPVIFRYTVEEGKLTRQISDDFKIVDDKESWEDPEVWAEGIEAIAFQYAFKKVDPVGAGEEIWEWKGEWPLPEDPSKDPEVPRMVQVTVTVGGEKLRTIVDLPTGVLGTS